MLLLFKPSTTVPIGVRERGLAMDRSRSVTTHKRQNVFWKLPTYFRLRVSQPCSRIYYLPIYRSWRSKSTLELFLGSKSTKKVGSRWLCLLRYISGFRDVYFACCLFGLNKLCSKPSFMFSCFFFHNSWYLGYVFSVLPCKVSRLYGHLVLPLCGCSDKGGFHAVARLAYVPLFLECGQNKDLWFLARKSCYL